MAPTFSLRSGNSNLSLLGSANPATETCLAPSTSFIKPPSTILTAPLFLSLPTPPTFHILTNHPPSISSSCPTGCFTVEYLGRNAFLLDPLDKKLATFNGKGSLSPLIDLRWLSFAAAFVARGRASVPRHCRPNYHHLA